MGLGYLAFEDRAGSKQTFDTKTVAGPDGVHFFKVTSGMENANVIFKCRWTLFDEPPKNGNNNRLPPVGEFYDVIVSIFFIHNNLGLRIFFVCFAFSNYRILTMLTILRSNQFVSVVVNLSVFLRI